MRSPISISLEPREREILVYLARVDGVDLSREVTKLIREGLKKRLVLEVSQGMDGVEREKMMACFDEIARWH